MLQKSARALAQVEAGNISKNLLNEIFSLYRAKEITKKVYKNIMNSVKLRIRMDTIFVHSKNSKTSEPHKLLLKLLEK